VSYYEGDFYRGDPGFGSFIGSLAKKAVGFIPGFGPAASAVGGVLAKLPGKGRIMQAGRVLSKHPVLSAAGAAGAIGTAGAVMGRGGRMPGGAGGGAGGSFRKRRRMRVTNPKALRRAIRRATGFARLARRVLRFTSPKAPKGRAIFKHRRAKR